MLGIPALSQKNTRAALLTVLVFLY